MKMLNNVDQFAISNPHLPCRNFVKYCLGDTLLDSAELKAAKELKSVYLKKTETYDFQITLCKGTGCKSSGEMSIKQKLDQVLKQKGMTSRVNIIETGCRGFCEMGPLLEIFPQKIFYCKVKPEDVEDIVEKTLINNEIIKEKVFEGIDIADDIPFYNKQERRVLALSGLINPENINDSVAHGAYLGFKNILKQADPDDIINKVKESGLRGRGGGGFPTGIKWGLAKSSVSDQKYIVCNADEGDPGAFMDRSIIEGDPHKLIEGMLIAAYAIGADTGYVYVRAEYPLAISRLEIAIEQCHEMNLLGNNILDSGFNFHLKIKKGAGAFVCGEETALLASIEGRRGMPTVKPPYPAEKGLYGKPTNINNVETYANVPLIFLNGVDWYKSVGSENNYGTKIFAMTGNVNHTGLVEVPLGITLKELVFDIGGGIKDGRKFKAVQIGGPSGGCLTVDHLDMALDFDSLKAAGAMIGSGGLVVLDDKTCIVEKARYFMNFTQNESCGKCIPCREGTNRMLEIMTRITEGKGELDDLNLLQELAMTIKNASLCGLGKSAPNPVLSTMKYFKEEYLAHIKNHQCPAGECEALVSYTIDPDKCKGCSKCARICPVNAISGEIKHPYVIDQDVCVKCGSCVEACPFGAINS